VIAPASEKRSRPRRASELIAKVTRTFLEETIDFHSDNTNWHQALRYATWVWLLKQLKGDWLSLARITAMAEHTLRTMPALLEVVG